MNISLTIDTDLLLHHRLTIPEHSEHRCVIGGGLRGLVWGITWLEQGDTVSLIDDRQEIGTPSRRVGWLESSGVGYQWLKSKINLKSIMHTTHSKQYQSGLRVEWLEKLLTIAYLKLGGQVLSRTFVSKSNGKILIEGTSSSVITTDWTTIHNATGHQPSTPGAEGIPLNLILDYRWEGGVVSAHIFEKHQFNSPVLTLERTDNSLELWFKQDERPQSPYWLEIIDTHRSALIEELEISNHIERILTQHRESHDL